MEDDLPTEQGTPGYTSLHSWTVNIYCSISHIPAQLLPNQVPLGPFWKWDINKVILPIRPTTDIWIIPETRCFDENEILCATVVWVTISSLGLHGQFGRMKTYFIIDFSLKMNTKPYSWRWEKSLCLQHLPPEINWGRRKTSQNKTLSKIHLDFSTEGQPHRDS